MGPDPKPEGDEVKTQLRRILESNYFKKRKKLGEVLTCLVINALEGRTLDENDIQKELFGYAGYTVKGPNARNAVHHIRRLLPKYYATDGANDPILIELPKRNDAHKEQADAYPVVIRYNAGNATNRFFQLASERLRTLSIEAVNGALADFDDIANQNPDHLPARLAKIECKFIQTIFEYVYAKRIILLRESLEEAEILTNRFPSDVKVRLFFSVALFLSHQYKQSFEEVVIVTKAIQESADEALPLSFWLPIVHLLWGFPDNALLLANRLLVALDPDVRVEAGYALFLYFNREFVKAEQRLEKLLLVNPTEWIVHFALSLVYLALDKPTEAQGAYRRVRALLPHQHILDCIPLLAQCVSYRIHDEEISPHDLNELSRVYELLSNAGEFVQMAMLVAPSRPDSAVHDLRLALQHLQPLSLLFHVWPLFDPLRGREDFEQLRAQHIRDLEEV